MNSNVSTFGLQIHDSSQDFAEFFAPIMHDLDAYWWGLNQQIGPVRGDWLCHKKNEQFLDEAVVGWSGQNLCYFLLRPQSFGHLAPHFVCHEWSYFCGFLAPDEEVAIKRAKTLEATRDGSFFAAQTQLLLDWGGCALWMIDTGVEFVFAQPHHITILEKHTPGVNRISLLELENLISQWR